MPPAAGPATAPAGVAARRAAAAATALVLLFRAFGWPPLPPEVRTNVLVMGVDRRPGDRGRSDTMMIFSFAAQARTVRILSIPRDARVVIPGLRRHDKINSAYFRGGGELARRAAAGLLGVPVPYYVAVDLKLVKELVDAVGGVTVRITKAMNYEDPADNLRIHFRPGVHRLDGQKATEYLRYRGDVTGDFARIERQQQFVAALARELLKPRNLAQAPRLAWIVLRHVETNAPPWKLAGWAWTTALGRVKGMPAATLPGVARSVDGVSYVIVDEEAAAALVRRFIGR